MNDKTPPGSPQNDILALAREKYGGDESLVTDEERRRLSQEEPLAYVIGNIPFLSLTIDLSSHPLIPRPETEWWTELLIQHINNPSIYGRTQTNGLGTASLRVLDLCAGSGAIGLAVLKECSHARVSFGELFPEHSAQIGKNLHLNALDETRAVIRTGDLFAPFFGEQFDLIAANPPYIPTGRILPESVNAFEPQEALYAGTDGLLIIRRIAAEAARFLKRPGELWMECDTKQVAEVVNLLRKGGARESKIHNDQYGRPRLVVGYY